MKKKALRQENFYLNSIFVKKKVMNRKLAYSFFLLSAVHLFSHPHGCEVIQGQIEFQHIDDRELKITVADSKTILNWKEFSIDLHEVTRFVQPSSTSAVLNRVTGSLPSHLLGRLESNGRIYLVNPNGLVIGENAVINAASFTASTLDIHNRVFLDEADLTFTGTSPHAIQHLGTIHAVDGNISLLAARIEVKGSLQAENGNISLLCGQEVILKPEGGFAVRPKLSVEELATFLEQVEAGGLYSAAFCCAGADDALEVKIENGFTYLSFAAKAQARHDNGEGGRICLVADQIFLEPKADIDVAAPLGNGQVIVGGDYKGNNPSIPNADYLYVKEGAKINADALENGNGGRVILWAEGMNAFEGSISVRGGPLSGDGGFVEISSHGLLLPSGPVDASAPQGKFGTLLFDPCQVTISTAATVNVTSPPPPFPMVGMPVSYVFSMPTANINNGTLVSYLNAANVTIDAGASGGGTVGTIDINNAVVWGTVRPTTLTLIATDAITFTPVAVPNFQGNLAMVNTTAAAGTPSIVMTAPVVRLGLANGTLVPQIIVAAYSGDVNITASTGLEIYGGVNAPGTNILACGNGNVNIVVGDLFMKGSIATNTDVEGSIHATGSGNINITANGNISVIARASKSNIDHVVSFTNVTYNLPVAFPAATGTGATTIMCPNGDLTLIGGTSLSVLAPQAGIRTLTNNITIDPVVNLHILGGIPTANNANCQAAITTNTSGNISINVLNDTFLIGGGGGTPGDASAVIRSSIASPGGGTGTINFAGNNLTLIGGTGTSGAADRSADIAGLRGTATGTKVNINLLGSLNMMGGNGTGSAAASIFDARIRTTDVGGRNDLQISAPGGITMYAGTKIGAGTGTANATISTASGNISIAGVAPFLNLYGGPASGIGVSPPAAAQITTATGAITITATDILLEAGLEEGGVITPTASISNTSSGNISLNYTNLTLNGSASATATNSIAQISAANGLITLTPLFGTPPTVSLQAGNAPGSSANIGAPLNVAPTLTSVTLNAAPAVSLQGCLTTTGTGNQASITAFSGNVTLNGISSLSMIGGMATTSTAQISTNGPSAANISGSIQGNAALVGGNLGNAFIETLNIGNVDLQVSGFLDITGGTSMDVSAFIGTTTGDVGLRVGRDVTLTGGTAMNAFSRIVTFTEGDISTNRILGDLILNGGTGMNAHAQVITLTTAPLLGNILLNIAGDIVMTGGLGAAANAQVFATTGDVTLSDIDGSVALIGGRGAGSSAQIGTTTGDIFVDDILGDLTITGGTNTAANAQIVTVNGDITIDAVLGALTMTGGSGMNAVATIETDPGAIDVTIQGLAQISGGTGAGSSALITTVTDGNITAQFNNNLRITGGSAMNAQAGISAQVIGDVSVGVIPDAVIIGGTAANATALIQAAQDNVDFIVGRNLSMASHSADASVIAGNNNNVLAGVNICALGDTASATFASIIGANTAGSTGFLRIEAGDNICMNPNSLFSRTSTAQGDLDAIAGNDYFMDDFSFVTNLSPGNTSLVCDNDFPTSPGIGPGRFITRPLSNVNTGGGINLRIFTARPTQNSFLGLLNGQPPSSYLIPGNIFDDTLYEQWCTYYFSGFGGVPFTVFYKPCQGPIVAAGNTVVSELLFDLQPLYIEWPEESLDLWKFRVLYDKSSYTPRASSYRFSPDEHYWIRRMRLRYINNPYVNRGLRTL
jgi:filamentous hemagglutinin family protein